MRKKPAQKSSGRETKLQSPQKAKENSLQCAQGDFMLSQEVQIVNHGKSEVHLTGYQTTTDMMDPEGELGEDFEIDSDGEDEDPPQLVQLVRTEIVSQADEHLLVISHIQKSWQFAIFLKWQRTCGWLMKLQRILLIATCKRSGHSEAGCTSECKSQIFIPLEKLQPLQRDLERYIR